MLGAWHVARETVAKRFVDRDGDELARRIGAFGRHQMDDFVSLAPACEASGVTGRWTLDQHLQLALVFLHAVDTAGRAHFVKIVRDGVLEIQGDHRRTAVEFFRALGFKVTGGS